MKLPSRSLSVVFTALSTTSLLSACIDYKQQIVETCKGTSITVGQMEKELRLAYYNGPFGYRHVEDELEAYNRASCGPVITCRGRRFWDQIDYELWKAGYDGPRNHDGFELQKYNQTACPEREG